MNAAASRWKGWVLSTALVLACTCAGCKDDGTGDPPVLQQEVYGNAPLDYLLFMPASTAAMENGKYPLILSLHGIGESGSNLQLLKQEGLPRILDGYNSFPFLVVSPQCPASTEWYYDRTDTLVDALLDTVVRRYPVDTMRIYITGYSMGGIGTWDMCIRHPHWFASAVPIAARRESGWDPTPMRAIPVWAFHGELDDVVPLAKGKDIVNALTAVGGTAVLTVYSGVYHDSWTKTYDNTEVYSWMLSKRRSL